MFTHLRRIVIGSAKASNLKALNSSADPRNRPGGRDIYAFIKDPDGYILETDRAPSENGSRWTDLTVKRSEYFKFPRQRGAKSALRGPQLITLIFLLASACDLPEPPKVVTISNVPTFRPSSPEQVQTIEQAIAAIITVSRDDLRLPVVDPLEVRLYKNTASFASYGTKAWIFRNDVAHLAGTAERNKIHINLDKTQHEPWASAIWVLAHEYGHNVENDLMTIRVHPRWFIEGFAEWVAATVVDALHWQSYALTIRRIKVQLARHREFIPALSSLSDNRDWESFIRKPKGGVTAYALAAAAVDRLIEKAGAASAIEYISSGDFESAFGESLAEFEIDVQKIGGEFERRQQREFLMRKPEWKIGYRWVYEETAFGRKTALLAQINKEDSVRGRLVFVVKFGDGEELYDKDRAVVNRWVKSN